MKVLFRVLVILVVAAIVGGLMYVGVNASSSSSTGPSFEEGRPLPQEGAEFRPDEERGGGLPFGVVKALVLMSIAGGIYSTIVWAGKKAKRAATA